MTHNDDEVRFLAALLTTRPGETLADRLTAYLKPPAWHALAACAGMGPAAFFPEGRGSSPAAGLEVCSGCPVVAECREAGAGELGVWGGTTEKERRLIRSSGRLAPPAA